MSIVLFGAAWIACGLIAAGWDNAYFQRKYPTIREPEDWGRAIGMGVFAGPIVLIAGAIFFQFGSHYGWSLRRDAVAGTRWARAN